MDFVYEPQPPRVGQRVTLTGSVTMGTGPISYTWSLGDGSVDSGPVITHIFPATVVLRTYPVTLTATNACPSQGTVSRLVTVWPHRLYLPVVLRGEPAR